MAVINDNGVMMYFSFLLLEIRFIRVLIERYTAMTIAIILVVRSENHKGR